jgi:hypothetical protein
MASFTPPDVSAALCENVPFEIASNTATDNKAEFDAFDQTPEGMNDPSRCKALLAFPDGTIFWSSKMAIDADGPAAGVGRLSGSQLDPDSGQNDTSFHFCDTDQALPSEAVPYIVLPGATFRSNTDWPLATWRWLSSKTKSLQRSVAILARRRRSAKAPFVCMRPCIRLHRIRVRCVSLTGVASVSLMTALTRTFYSSYFQIRV